MSKCDNCGRDDGHWLGCQESSQPLPRLKVAIIDTVPESAPGERERTRMSECIVDGCSEPRRSEDKRVKFCTEHSDPKNRK